LTPENVTSQGRIDLTLKLDAAIVVIEFKRAEGSAPTGEALAQLKTSGYADKYCAGGRTAAPVSMRGVGCRRLADRHARRRIFRPFVFTQFKPYRLGAWRFGNFLHHRVDAPAPGPRQLSELFVDSLRRLYGL